MIDKKRLRMLLVISVIAALPLSSVPIVADPSPSHNHYDSKSVVAEGFVFPTDIAIAPDGRIFVAEKDGIIKIVDGGSVSTFATFDVNSTGERGLVGMTLDPDFSNNGYVYVYYTNRDPLENHISRLTASGNDMVDGSETILYTIHPWPQHEIYHQAGGLKFGPDGKLYFTMGDNIHAESAQMTDNPNGKMFRINKDGTIPSDNPFVGKAGLDEVYAYGLRNPFRFSFLPNGNPIVGDVGEHEWEEIDIVKKGGNYGWPESEGTCGSCPYVNPIFQYRHVNVSNEDQFKDGYDVGADLVIFDSSVTGGVFYKGKYFYADFVRGFVRTLTFDSSFNNVLHDAEFDSNNQAVVDFEIGPDGNLYTLSIYPGLISKYSGVEGYDYDGSGDDGTGLRWSQPSAVRGGENFLLSAKWNSDIPLYKAVLSTNETGEWTNYTELSLTGNSGWSNFTWSGTLSPGSSVAWRIYAFDSQGNTNATEIRAFTVPQTNPFSGFGSLFSPSLSNPAIYVVILLGIGLLAYGMSKRRASRSLKR